MAQRTSTTHNRATEPTLPLKKEEVQIPPQPLGSEHVVLIIPYDEEERQASAMENWYQACGSDDAFAVELVGNRREQGFVLRASSQEQLLLLCKQLSAQYPQAEIQPIAPTADPLLLHAGEHAIIGDFSLAHKPFLPLKTFSGKILAEPGADPMAGILAAMEPLGSGQRIISQISLVRAPENWINRYVRKSVEHPLQQERDADPRAGQPATSNSKEGAKTLLLLVGAFVALFGYRWYHDHAWLQLILLGLALLIAGILFLWWWITHSQQEIYDMKLVAEKLSRAAFYTNLRVVVIGKQATSTEQQLCAHLTRLEVAYRQYTLASANSLYIKKKQYITPQHKLVAYLTSPDSAFPYRHPLLKWLHGGALSPNIWNSLELVGAFHLPQALTDLPLVRRLSVKHLLASPEIARQLEQAEASLPPALIGYSQHRGYKVPVYMPFSTLFSHKFLVAKSRYGKSTLIQLLVQAAMQPVRDGTLQPGAFVIDPHKDTIDDILTLIPPERLKDVVLLDLTDTQHVVALNPLDASMGFTRDQAISNLMSSFERIWADFWGPRMSYFLKSVCLLLYTINEQFVREGMAEKQFTLLDINPLLQNTNYAIQVLSLLDMSQPWHQELFNWWQTVYFTMPKQFRNEVIMPIISKLGTFNDNQLLRRIVGQPVTKAPVHLCITEGKIVLCALSGRDMDDSSLNILGSTFINLLHRSFWSQQSVPLQERRKVFCAVDEFHVFSGGDFDRLLSEDGKFGCSMLLATQSLKRLNKIRDGLMEMVFSICDNVFAFNVSAADAKLLQEELRGVVEQKHIISQPRLHCYARLSIPDYPLQIVSVTLAKPASWQHSAQGVRQANWLRQHHQKQNRLAADIDKQYEEHIKHYIDIGPLAQDLKREARSSQATQQDREQGQRNAENARLAKQQVDQIQRQQGTNTPSTPAPNNAGAASLEASTAPAHSSSEQRGAAEEKSLPPTGTIGTAGQSMEDQLASPSGQEENDGDGRSHARSKRKKRTKKQPVGFPPPPPPSLDNPLDLVDPQEDIQRHLLSTIIKSSGLGGSERERGE